MTIKPWREIAKPHKDVLEGTFKQSEFTADISLVQRDNPGARPTWPPSGRDARAPGILC